jgi:hypothetical protein
MSGSGRLPCTTNASWKSRSVPLAIDHYERENRILAEHPGIPVAPRNDPDFSAAR